MAQTEQSRCVGPKVITDARASMPNVTVDSERTNEENEKEVVIKTATNYLKEYATSKGLTLQSIGRMPPTHLAEILREFYSTVRGYTDELPPSFTLRYIREGLQRYFQKSIGIDIVKDKTFDFANTVFDVALRHAYPSPRKCHRLRIDQDDLKRIYMSDQAMCLDRPDTLQNKVFFDVNMYICNRGKDFLRVMTKNDFELTTDTDGRKYVWLKYHSKFCFRELAGGIAENETVAGNQIGDRMYERQGDPKCPVKSFKIYISHLHPMCEAFWQRPKRNVVVSDYVWYDNTPLGNSTLSKVMQRMSHQSGISENYTNHAIRHTYAPVIEQFCHSALQNALFVEKAELSPASGGEEFGAEDTSSVSSQRDEEAESGETIGLRPAKMKVLEMVHGLVVKDIQVFVDWLKTFYVQHDSGGLVVMCSPVDQPNSSDAECKPRTMARLTTPNGNLSQSKHQPLKEKKSKGDNPNSTQSSELQGARPTVSPVHYDDDIKTRHHKELPFIKKVEFQCIGETHCSVGAPVRVTIPSKDTVVLTGIQNNTELLINHKRNSIESEVSIESRVYHSCFDKNMCDLVAAHIQKSKNPFSASDVKVPVVQDVCDKKTLFDNDKYKPVKKRTIHSSIETVNNYEEPAFKKQFYLLANHVNKTEKSPLQHVSREKDLSKEKTTGSDHMCSQNLKRKCDDHLKLFHQSDNKFLQTHGCGGIFAVKIKTEPVD